MKLFLIFLQYIIDILLNIKYDIISFIIFERSEGDEMKNLKLKAARAKKDLTQAELADKVGVTRQTIGLIETGKYNPTISLCIDICKVLDQTLNDLFWEDEIYEK
jgi:putative transcriptional regulator